MIVETYQSRFVLKVLKAGQVYRAKPNLMLKGEYDALIDMLGLQCECPIFGVVKGKKQRTLGKVSGSVKLVLNVPDDQVRLTEFSEWADFLYAFKYTMPGNYSSVGPASGDVSDRQLRELIAGLKQQKKLSDYQVPQAVLEEIRPEWIVRYRVNASSGEKGLWGKLKGLFGK